MTTTLRAAIFDLDGTLVQTEELKAQSYARAAELLCPGCVTAEQVIDAYDDMVGRSRDEVARTILTRFHLEAAATAHLTEYHVNTPLEALIHLRLEMYEKMIRDRSLLEKQAYPHTIALLKTVKGMGFPVGLATMSHMAQAVVVLEMLDLRRYLDVVVTRDMVQKTKPDPEIYLLTAGKLGVAPESCLVIEDSLPGVQSALAAGMTCVAVSTPMTKTMLHESGALPPELIVDDPATLDGVVRGLLGASSSSQQSIHIHSH